MMISSPHVPPCYEEEKDTQVKNINKILWDSAINSIKETISENTGGRYVIESEKS